MCIVIIITIQVELYWTNTYHQILLVFAVLTDCVFFTYENLMLQIRDSVFCDNCDKNASNF